MLDHHPFPNHRASDRTFSSKNCSAGGHRTEKSSGRWETMIKINHMLTEAFYRPNQSLVGVSDRFRPTGIASSHVERSSEGDSTSKLCPFFASNRIKSAGQQSRVLIYPNYPKIMESSVRITTVRRHRCERLGNHDASPTFYGLPGRNSPGASAKSSWCT